ncbi:MAG: ComEC/Rec2 family competence protein [Oscillospiraceae bacterium]|jgi:competence protein ComEC|nr:ComEC/Rec2 family competence protein [Oscillospiraceae bacterium]
MRKYVKRVLFALLAALVYIGWRAAHHALFLREAYAKDGETLYCEIEISSFPRESAYGFMFEGRAFGVTATVYTDAAAELKPGDRVRGEFRFRAGYSYGSHLTASQQGDLERVPAEGVPLRHRPAYWAQSVRERIYSLFPPEQAAFINGLLTGDKSGFTVKTTDNLFRAGMSHVAAVSGLHISMLAGFAALFFRKRWLSLIFCIPLIFLYTAIAGFPLSAIRAGLMYALLLLAPVLMREYKSINALCAAAAIILTAEPYALHDVRFLLSVSSTLGIVLFAGKLGALFLAKCEKARIIRRLPAGVRRAGCLALASSLAAMVFSTPIAALEFDGISVIAPFCNALLLWAVTAIFILSAAALGLSAVYWPLGYYAAFPARWILAFFLGAVDLAARIPFAAVYTRNVLFAAWLVFLYACLLTGIMRKSWKQPAAFALSAFVLMLALSRWREGRWGLTVSVLDVGQGQCVIVRSQGETAVIDCGGSAGAGRAAYGFLRAEGETEIDFLLLTHAHEDHTNGVDELNLLMPAGSTFLPATQEILSAPPDFAFSAVREPEELTLGKARISLIPAQWMPGMNEQCMAVIVEYDGFSFVTTGDMDAASERWLLRAAQFPSGGVLLAGHHGSNTSGSEEFLAALTPKTVMVSVGRNTYGHPSPEAMRRFEDIGAQVYDTRTYGDITVHVP